MYIYFLYEINICRYLSVKFIQGAVTINECMFVRTFFTCPYSKYAGENRPMNKYPSVNLKSLASKK